MENTEKKIKEFVTPLTNIENPYEELTKKIDFKDKIKEEKPFNIFSRIAFGNKRSEFFPLRLFPYFLACPFFVLNQILKMLMTFSA